jgi:hypothetical protein
MLIFFGKTTDMRMYGVDVDENALEVANMRKPNSFTDWIFNNDFSTSEVM